MLSRLLIEAGRTDVTAAIQDNDAILIVDNREFPVTRLDETVEDRY